MAGVPIESVGWTEISVVSQEKTNETIQAMLSKYSEIQGDAFTSYLLQKDRYKPIITLILSIELILMLGLVTRQGRRIVQPLNSITKRISEIQGSDMEFEDEKVAETDAAVYKQIWEYTDIPKPCAVTHLTAQGYFMTFLLLFFTVLFMALFYVTGRVYLFSCKFL